MFSSQRTYQVVSDSGTIPSTLSYEDQQAYEEELTQGLTSLQLRSNCRSLTLLPNFDFGWLLPPPTGYVAEFDLSGLFHSDPFRANKFGVFLKAKISLNPASLTTERHKEIEKSLRIGFPWPENAPLQAQSMLNLESLPSEGWTPYFHAKGCSVGIYHSTQKDVVENKTIETYYIIAHTELPRTISGQLQVLEEQISADNAEYLRAVNSNLPLPDGVKPVTYYDVFGPGSPHERALLLAVENAKRIVAVFSTIIDVPLVQPLYEAGDEKEVYSPSEIEVEIKFKSGGFSDAQRWWPKQLPVFPFTVLPNFEIENFLGEMIPKHIQGFPLGQVLEQLRTSKPKDFEDLLKKTDLEYKYKIERFEPDTVTDFNTFRIKNQALVYYAGCTDTRQSNHGVLLYEGLDLGFKHLNPSSTTSSSSQNFQWINQFKDSYPVIFPWVSSSSSSSLDQKKIKQDTVAKSFSREEGGISPNFKMKIPAQIHGLFANLRQLSSPSVCNLLGTTGLPQEELVPDKVMLSKGSLDISRF
jgi:hypothetical protein